MKKEVRMKRNGSGEVNGKKNGWREMDEGKWTEVNGRKEMDGD